MTDIRIEQMTADELRRAIAAAKGIELITITQTNPSRNGFNSFVTNSKKWRFPNGYIGGEPPDWPGDIAAAWVLVEEMGQHNWSVTIENLPERKTEVVCRVFQHFLNDTFLGGGETAPLAICRAYLAWKEATK